MNPIFQSKKIIRTQIREQRKQLSPQAVFEKSRHIVKSLQTLPVYLSAKTVHCYVSWHNEVHTHELIKSMLVSGRRVVVPVVNMQEQSLVHSQIRSFDDLQKGTFGILEPKPEAMDLVAPEELDLVLVPGIAFDKRGYRLGYGGGFYDTFLAQTKTVKVGLAFDFQIVDLLPTREEDERVNLIVSEKRIYHTKD